VDLGLKGKTVLIVGGNSNIGRATSIAFAKEGANVAIAARDIKACRETAKTANSFGGGRAIPIKADATVYKQAETAVNKTLEEFGQIDVLVHGTAWDIIGSFMDLDPENYEKIIAVNFTSVLYYFRLVLPLMISRKSGNIITMTSVMGRRGEPGEPVYGACKAGVIILCQAIARDVGRYGIRVNSVAPGPTFPTKDDKLSADSVYNPSSGQYPVGGNLDRMVEKIKLITPLGKAGKPSDTVSAVLFLASDVAAGHITGNVIGVDGGLYMGL
jgi:NAD(P)-dependent dehydrogenase (short-subunit alcohol dehydrogenase family)